MLKSVENTSLKKVSEVHTYEFKGKPVTVNVLSQRPLDELIFIDNSHGVTVRHMRNSIHDTGELFIDDKRYIQYKIFGNRILKITNSNIDLRSEKDSKLDIVSEAFDFIAQRDGKSVENFILPSVGIRNESRVA
jgi:hypothetical protein